MKCHLVHNHSQNTYENDSLLTKRLSRHVYLHSDITIRPIELLLDTGSMITLLAGDLLRNDVPICSSSLIITGITGSNNAITTLGSASGNIWIKQTPLRTNFQLIDRAFCGLKDGYLGMDFLLKYRAIIDLHNNKISLMPAHDITTNCTCSFDQQTDQIFNDSTREYEMEEIVTSNIDEAICKFKFGNTGCTDCANTGRGVLLIKCKKNGRRN